MLVVIVLILVNVMWNTTLDARSISSSDKENQRATKWEQKFERSQKRQKINGELDIDGQKFGSLGCWKDSWSRSLPTIEGEHYLLMDPNYKGRKYALFKCARAALDKGYKVFGIENGGQCFASTSGDKRYHKYGASKDCKDDGKGGPWSLQVYRFSAKDFAVNGGYSPWSSWGTCSKSCLGGVRRRDRKCSNPSPSNGGRDCESLGSSVESQDCNVKSCPDDADSGDHKSRSKWSLSAKRDGSQVQPIQVGFSQSGSPLQVKTKVSDRRKPATGNQYFGHQSGHIKQPDVNNDGYYSDKEEEKYIAWSPKTNGNGVQSNAEDEKKMPMSSHEDNKDLNSPAGTKEERKPSVVNNGHRSQDRVGDKQDDLSQQQSFKSASHVGKDNEYLREKEKMSSQRVTDNLLKRPMINQEPLRESSEDEKATKGDAVEDSKSSNAMELSQNSFNGGEEKLGKDVGSMANIPNDKIHHTVENLNDKQKEYHEFSSFGEPLNAKLGFSGKVPTDAVIQEQNIPEQQYKAIADLLGHDQGIEIRIRPSGRLMASDLKYSQPKDVEQAEQNPNEMSAQEAQQYDQDQGKAPAGGKASYPSTMQGHTGGKNNENDMSHEQNGSETPGNGGGAQISRPGSHELETETTSKPNAVNRPETTPPQKPSTSNNEKQDPEQKVEKDYSTSNQPQAPASEISQQGKNVEDKNQLLSENTTTALSKEKPDASEISAHGRPNPVKDDNTASTGKVDRPQQVSDSSNAHPLEQEISAHQAPKTKAQESDQEKEPDEAGEPVPAVDLNTIGNPGGADYEPTSNEAVSGPPEDASETMEPTPDSQAESQPPGPIYDNEAIQGVSELSQRLDQKIMQQANSPGTGAGFDELSMSKAYTGEFPSEKPKEGLLDDTTTRRKYPYQYQIPAPLTPTKYETEAGDNCLCPKKECSAKADIAFLVDGSSNIPQPYYARVLEFIKILSRGFEKNIVHVGMMAYGDDVKVALTLEALTDFKQFDDAVNIAPYMGGKARTGNALAKLKTALFGSSGRQGALRALILLSSGGSVDDVVAPGLELRDSGVKITAIGLGKQANVRELITVASEPKSEHVFTAFLDTLPDSMDQIIEGVCKDVIGVVRDRQEPCTCETYNGQVGPTHEYTREPPSEEFNTVDRIAQQEQLSSFSQSQGKGDGAFDQNENLGQQSPTGYQLGNGDEGVTNDSQSSNATDKPVGGMQISETGYGSEQQSIDQGDLPEKFSTQGTYYGQAFGGEEERPSSQPLQGDQQKALNEERNRPNTQDSLGAVESSSYPGYKNDGGYENSKSNAFENAKHLTHVEVTYRFSAGLPEHFKPNSGDGDGVPVPSNQLMGGHREGNDEPPLNQEITAGENNQFPFFFGVNHERVQGGGSRVQSTGISTAGNDFHEKPLKANELTLAFRGPTKFIAVDKQAENVNKAQEDNRQECGMVNLGVVIDSSTSFGGQGRRQAAQMMNSLAKRISRLFPISPEGNSVGMVVFGGSPQPSVVSFDKFSDQRSMDEAIDNASNPNLEIRIGKALTVAQKHLFNELALSKRNVLLLVTDATSLDDVSRPALELKRRGIEIFCLGVGNNVTRAQLDSIASEPKKSHVFWAPYSDSERMMQRIKNEICQAASKPKRQ
ncbi:uncharacterized protein [Montipora foliosa]|uniref:uncharacterized protein isoform X3 n=1 Tax=Montipora foliosa TaxID=591990 RepID=UPI0035F11341